MTAVPTTKYAKSGDVHIAYQVVGEGPHDLVLVPGWVSHVEYAWEEPSSSSFLRRLASFSRLIILDRRGTGLSDKTAQLPSLEQQMDDVRAVMDAAGSARAALWGLSEGGPMCITFAATYPGRTSALILYGSFAMMARAPDYPIGVPAEAQEKFVTMMKEGWGTGVSADIFGPSVCQDEHFRRSWARFERFAVSPSGIEALLRMVYATDVRHVLPVIRVPTLILHRQGDRPARVDHARYMAGRIPGAKYVELPGVDHFPFVGDMDGLLDEVEEFLTGMRHGPEPDRVLATIMFTDIVGSTERVAELGDRRWRELLEQHRVVVRREMARFRGREVETAGDSFLMIFDGPARAIRCACAARDAVRALGIEIKVGLHTGECELMGDRIGGIAVHIGARIAEMAGPAEVLVSSTVRDLVAGSGIGFEDRRVHMLKGVPGKWHIYVVASA